MHTRFRGLLNRLFAGDVKRLTAQAEQHVRERLDRRPIWPVDALLERSGVEARLRTRANLLLEMLATVLRVDPGTLRPDERLTEMLCVSGGALGPGSTEVLARYGPQEAIEVFGYDILHLLETKSDPELWTKQWSSLPSQPKGEDDRLDVILAMTLGEFLSFGAAMLPNKQ